MRELVVVSGKGGTGKTSISGALVTLGGKKVIADCDVDAANLHLLLNPSVKKTHSFTGGYQAFISPQDCIGCGFCKTLCRFEGISQTPCETGFKYTVNPHTCEGCGVCVEFCPDKCIELREPVCGEWYESTTRHGSMVHARLIPGAENSGKLVAAVRQAARQRAEEEQGDLIIIDGPPGIGCPVISSITGTSLLLLVIEPTLACLHDMERVIKLAGHFKIPCSVCINKCDVNTAISDLLESDCLRNGIPVVGKIPFELDIVKAQRAGCPVTEFTPAGKTSRLIKEMWTHLESYLNTQEKRSGD